MAQTLTYCGGIPDIKKTGEYPVTDFPDCVTVQVGLVKSVKIPYADITDISIKTDEQISNDVTLTRLLLLGVLAFGAKKKRKNTVNFLVIDYNYSGMATSAIFSGKDVPTVHSKILKSRAKWLKRNPQPTPAPAPAADPYTEIEKLHGLMEKGIVSEEEFNAKKAQLLGI